MEKRKIKEEDVLLLAIAAITLISVYALFRKKPFTSRMRSLQPEKYPYLKIEKELIQHYLDKKGKKIKFKFKEQNDVIKLRFIGSRGFRGKVIDQIMNTVGSQYEVLENIEFGRFRDNENGEKLHDILTGAPLKDWYLRPVKNKTDASYVSYDLSDNLAAPMIMHRINPCPPCNSKVPD